MTSRKSLLMSRPWHRVFPQKFSRQVTSSKPPLIEGGLIMSPLIRIKGQVRGNLLITPPPVDTPPKRLRWLLSQQRIILRCQMGHQKCHTWANKTWMSNFSSNKGPLPWWKWPKAKKTNSSPTKPQKGISLFKIWGWQPISASRNNRTKRITAWRSKAQNNSK